jgi:LPXTG-site transpeptidase (sortase) family protein
VPRGRAPRAGRASLGLVAVGLAVCALFLTVDYVGSPSATPTSSGQQVGDRESQRVARHWRPPSTVPPAVPTDRVAVPRAREPGAGAPYRVVIDVLGIDVPVVPIHLEVSTLVPPSDPQTLGWWADGAVPGAKRGSAIITGHTVHTGGGALDNLEHLVPGDVFSVRTDAGSIDYWVSRVEVFDKERVSRASTRLFSQGVRGRLVLITCEDWDGTGYDSNVVVIARPL